MKYCLRPEAKKNLKEIVVPIGYALLGMQFIFSLVAMVGMLVGFSPRETGLDIYMYYSAIVGFITLTPTAIYFVGKWLRRNIVACEELEELE